MLDAAADAFHAARAPPRAPIRIPSFKVVQSAGGYGMESPGLIWIPHGVGTRQPALPRRPRDGPPVVLRARRQRPVAASRSPTRRPPTSSRAPSSACGARSRCATATLDRSIYAYTRRLLLRDDLHPGRQPARRRAAGGWARPRSGRRSAGTSRPTGTGSSTTATLLDALDAGDAARPAVDAVRPALPEDLLTVGRRRAGVSADAATRRPRPAPAASAGSRPGAAAARPASRRRARPTPTRSRGPHGSP